MIYQRTYDEIRQSIRSNINDTNNEVDTKAGTFVSDVFVSPASDQLAAYYGDLKIVEMNQCITTATGYDLDRLGYNYFTYRRSATYADGVVRFYIKNTNRTKLVKSSLPSSIHIPNGFKVSTASTSTSDEVIFLTQESVYVTQQQIYNSLPTDTSTGYKYIEVDIKAYVAGSSGNCAAGTITTLYDGNISGIVSCYNPYATTNGEDEEPDMALRARIMLAILGASICTKKGYEKFMLQQDNVQDVLVVGAGDELMFRDGGYIGADKNYIYGRGGMVDIWIRGKQTQEYTKTFQATSTYLKSEDKDIVLDYQPVVNIVSVVAQSTGLILDNAANYELEYSVDSNNTVGQNYYVDILWDFSVTENFTDTDYYNMKVKDVTEIEILRKSLNSALTDIKEEMQDLNYSINWAFQEQDTEITDTMFKRILVNNNLYKIIAIDERLDGRTFVKRNGKIYERCYAEPDYALVPSTYSDEKYTSQMGNDLSGSILSQDCIHWLKTDKLQEGETYVITYNYNQLIKDLQTEMSAKRILTADILIRQAVEVDVQVGMTVYVDNTVDATTVKATLNTIFATFINNYIPMGGSLEESQLAAAARRLSGVTMVDLDTVYIAKKNALATNKLSLEPNEYFQLTDIAITMVYDE